MYIYAYLCLIYFLLLQLSFHVSSSSSTNILVKFIKFVNSGCCDLSCYLGVGDICDHKFTICLDKGTG